MPRIYKGSEDIINLLVPLKKDGIVSELTIILYTDNPELTAEYTFTDVMLVDDVFQFSLSEWPLNIMNDGVINYIAKGVMDREKFIFERQSNYYLKTPSNFAPVFNPDDYYTKTEVDEMISDIEIGNVDLTGYATESWVKTELNAIVGDINNILESI